MQSNSGEKKLVNIAYDNLCVTTWPKKNNENHNPELIDQWIPTKLHSICFNLYSWTAVLVVCLGRSWGYFTPYIHHFNVQTQINIPPSIIPCILLRNTKSPGCLFLLPVHNLQVCLRTYHLSVCWILSLSFELFLCV